ncbi:hypothetical protein LOD99_2836 [Oopsacas minuta]|uniref:NEDD4-binding protein 2-like 1 n=1 Tax=Oopsacas minuta TaxID=111878 RepID=A0AAV7K165_9METZ|nr:hypothetical protein LOD99_2836 [Oopsacas minuta]
MASLYETGGSVLYIMRGCPGSGKSTLATELKGSNGRIFSTDNFFIQSNGEYVFDPKKVAVYHKRNQERAREAISEGVSPVVIDNTNTTFWEMRPYVETGLRHGYRIEFVEPSTPWRYDPDQLYVHNSHGVPVETIKRMLKRFQKYPTVEKIMSKRTGKSSNDCQVLIKEAPKFDNSDISDIRHSLATSEECIPNYTVPISNSFNILTPANDHSVQGLAPQETPKIDAPSL